MELPPFLSVRENEILLAVKLQPRASRNEIGNMEGKELKVRVSAPPVDSAANEALVGLLAETLDCPRGAVKLVRGHTSRHKIISVRGLSAQLILARLLPPRQGGGLS